MVKLKLYQTDVKNNFVVVLKLIIRIPKYCQWYLDYILK